MRPLLLRRAILRLIRDDPDLQAAFLACLVKDRRRWWRKGILDLLAHHTKELLRASLNHQDAQ